MTPEDKRDRRKARQEVEAAFRPLLRRRMGLYATNRQIEAAVKVMADRYYAEQVRPAAERIERELIEQKSRLQTVTDAALHPITTTPGHADGCVCHRCRVAVENQAAAIDGEEVVITA